MKGNRDRLDNKFLIYVLTVLGLECAVCLPPDENIPIAKEIRRLFPDDQVTLISCQQANISNENIIKTCPPESSSCHIQKTSKF